MKNTTRKKKESFVVFEDWMKYSRFLNDAEFRQFINNILNYYKGIEPVLNTSNLQEVWQDIVDDLNVNIAKKQIKRDIMLKNAVSNPKLNIVPNIEPDTKTQYRDPISVPNIEPETSGMVDGRWDMGDDKMGDEKMMYEYMGEDDDGFPTIKLPVSQSSRRRSEEFDKIFEENWD